MPLVSRVPATKVKLIIQSFGICFLSTYSIPGIVCAIWGKIGSKEHDAVPNFIGVITE